MESCFRSTPFSNKNTIFRTVYKYFCHFHHHLFTIFSNALYRANKNDQFNQLFSDRNGVHQAKSPMLALSNTGVNGDALYYKTQSEKLSKQLNTMSKQLEQADRLRRMEISSRRMDSGIVSLRDMSGMNRTQDMLMMNRSLLSNGGGRAMGDGDYRLLELNEYFEKFG